jgi:DNA mismatch repair protein MutS2
MPTIWTCDVNAKHLSTLELPKILDRLATFASFSAGAELARALTPATSRQEIRWQLETTSEARTLLDVKPETSLGGAHDIRPLAADAEHGRVLPPSDLLDVRDTLVAGRTLHRTLNRLESQFPRLAYLAARIQASSCGTIIAEIDRCLDERGNVRDDASPELARIRREVNIAHNRIQDKLQNIITSSSSAQYLQETLVTQREGRYVVPLKAQFKDRIPGIVHDRSASGVTLFVEPLSIVKLNNAWRELQFEETQEVNRILAHLSNLVAERADEIEETVEALAELDLAFAKARYAETLRAAAPELVPLRGHSNSNHPGSTIRLVGARHPLLDPQSVVPIDVVLDDDVQVLIITGPNTGGKTVSLKTVGLLTLMAQAGLHIPVEPGSALSPFETVYADIGDEQSIEQNLSTFSSHLTNIVSFLEQANARSLVLLDELGAGTDPAEGAALARALLDHFRQRGATAFVATHYPELKTYAQLTPGVRNGCVEFDTETLSPTYKLTIGLPGRSNALAIAQRLQLPQAIVEAARRMISPDDLRTENMLDDIHRLRIHAAQERDAAHAARVKAEEAMRELRKRLATIDQERQEILEQAREDAEAELETLRAEIRALRGRLWSSARGAFSPGAAATPLAAVAAIEEQVEALEAQVQQPIPLESPIPPGSAAPIRPGNTVWVRPLNAEGEVLEIDGEDAEVQVGRVRTRVNLTALELRAQTSSPREGGTGWGPERSIQVSAASSPGMRLDLRGCLVEEALQRLDRHLDQAMRARLPQMSIIHGKGTGALRQAVRDFLADHPLVSTYEAGGPREGGEGVTIANLVAR